MGTGISTSAKPQPQVKRSLPGPRGPSTRKGPKVKPRPLPSSPNRYGKVPELRSNIRYMLNKQQSTSEAGRSLPGPRGPSTTKEMKTKSRPKAPLSGRYRQASTSRSGSVYYEPSNQQSDDFFPWWWLWPSSQDQNNCSSDTSDRHHSSQEASDHNTNSHHGCGHSSSHDYSSSQDYGSYDLEASSSYDSGSSSYDFGSSSCDCSSYDSGSSGGYDAGGCD